MTTPRHADPINRTLDNNNSLFFCLYFGLYRGYPFYSLFEESKKLEYPQQHESKMKHVLGPSFFLNDFGLPLVFFQMFFFVILFFAFWCRKYVHSLAHDSRVLSFVPLGKVLFSYSISLTTLLTEVSDRKTMKKCFEVCTHCELHH